MSVNRWLGARFHPKTYTCLHFAADVWAAETGQDLWARLPGGTAAALASLVSIRASMRALTPLLKPESPCLAFFRPRIGTEPHIGVYLRGRVLHLPKTGPQFMTVDVVLAGFASVKFYK